LKCFEIVSTDRWVGQVAAKQLGCLIPCPNKSRVHSGVVVDFH